MMRFLILIVVLIACSQFLFGCGQADTLRAMTFNVRYAGASDGMNSWERRREFVVDTIRSVAPDVLGVQEALASQVRRFKDELSDYGFVGVGRDDGAAAGEFAPIFYNRERFALLGQGVFWLSPTPETPGSVGWDAVLPRIATWAKLRFKKASLPDMYVVNVHFDHVGIQSRTESAKLVREYVASLGDCPVLVMGDFNCPPASGPHDVLTADGDGGASLYDVFGDRKTLGTHHGFTGTPTRGRIDWILHSSHFEGVEAAVETRDYDGRYPSDHFPVWATLRLSK